MENSGRAGNAGRLDATKRNFVGCRLVAVVCSDRTRGPNTCGPKWPGVFTFNRDVFAGRGKISERHARAVSREFPAMAVGRARARGKLARVT